MKSKRRILAFLLSVVLCVGVLSPIRVSAASLYFTSLNDNLLPLTAENMPVWSDGVLYVPYTTFDSSVTGVDLKVYPRYSRSHNMVTLFGMRDEHNPTVLLFDLTKNSSQNDITKEPLPGRAIVRNGVPYLPVGAVCSFFGFTYSCTALDDIQDGYLVRIKNEAVVLSDSRFIDAASNLLQRRLKEYNQSIVPPSPPAPPPVKPEPKPEQSGEATAYLAVLCRDDQGLSGILDALTLYRTPALFLVSPELLRSQAGAIHQILARGHSVGLMAEGESWQESRKILQEGQTLLEQLAFTRATAVYVPSAQRAAAEKEGWICWNQTMTLSPGSSVSPASFASGTVSRLEGRSRAAYLLLTGGADGARVLPTLLHRLGDSRIRLRLPLETKI